MRKNIFASSKERALTDRLFMYLEKRPASDRFVFKLILYIFGASLLWFGIYLSQNTSVDVPANGGTFREGIVGTPRFVNPILAVTRADRDLTSLIYDGLMELSEDGTLKPNIAESITVSGDGLTYNITLRKDIVFHDGTPLTARDVIFTIRSIQDPSLTSPLRASFDGVVIEEVGEFEFNFILAEAYAPFIENLTVGILPQYIWSNATAEEFPFSQYNSEPIGTGPYKVKKIERNASGIPEKYILESNKMYQDAIPKISEVILSFYTNEETLIADFNINALDAVAGLSPSALEKLNISEETHTIITTPLPRTFAVFFNQNKSPALQDSAARKALDAAIDRSELVDSILSGYGVPIYSPIPPGFGIDTTQFIPDYGSSTPFDYAREILREGGWEINNETKVWSKEIDDFETPLSFSIATANSALFETTAEFLRTKWKKLGAQVTVKQFEQSDLTQAIIRPRDYQSLLFGTDVGRPLDFYSFWHSSQRNDPGLNVAMYANITTDSILTEARTNATSSERTEVFLKFNEEIAAETPAVFLYSPEFIYVFPKTITGASFNGLAESHERFTNIENWYIETDSIWPIFEE